MQLMLSSSSHMGGVALHQPRALAGGRYHGRNALATEHPARCGHGWHKIRTESSGGDTIILA